MEVKYYLDKVAYRTTEEICGSLSEIYRSKFDDSYITHVGMEDHVSFLAEREITEELTHGVGFSPKDGKWYGWSHRAIYGFGIGSTCKKGDCHYTPKTPQELFDSVTTPDEDGLVWHKKEDVEIIEKGIRIKVAMTSCGPKDTTDKCNTVIDMACQELAPENTEPSYFEIKCGRGEWVAKTLEDAKQMAIDFNRGVS